MINFFASYVSPNANEYIADVLKSTMLSEGTVTRQFEIALEKQFHLPDNSVICTNSGTSALHLAMKTLGIRLYDEVILPPQTFVATGMAILYADATPVFCDIGNDGNISIESAKDKINFNTKAIVAVNWAGRACDIEGLQKLAKENNLKLIIDAAQSIGVGMGGDITCLSFQATKHLTTGDGGAVICYNPDDYARARRLNWFGIDRQKNLPDILGERVYNLDKVGYKYHMNNIAAALGLANLGGFDDRMQHRKDIANVYFDGLDKLLLQIPVGADNAWWAFPIFVDDVREFSRMMKTLKVPVNNLHRGIDHNKIFGGPNPRLTNQRSWEKHVTHLPIHHEITVDDAMWICEQVNTYV